MKNLLRHPVRCGVRVLWLGGELLFAAGTGLKVSASSSGHSARPVWLQRHARRVLRVLNLRPAIEGTLPAGGYVVANHLSYLDILVLAATRPCVFVAKREVRGWPVFGWFARRAGTIFVDRARRSDTARVTAAMSAAVAGGALLVLFPEGTSSDGRAVLPFKSSLLEPLVGRTECTVAHLHYALNDGDVAAEVCYWRDMTLLPHLLNLLTKAHVGASLRLARVDTGGLDRKALAVVLRDCVAGLSNRRGGGAVRGKAACGAVTGLSDVCHVRVARL